MQCVDWLIGGGYDDVQYEYFRLGRLAVMKIKNFL